MFAIAVYVLKWRFVRQHDVCILSSDAVGMEVWKRFWYLCHLTICYAQSLIRIGVQYAPCTHLSSGFERNHLNAHTQTQFVFEWK